MIFIEDNYLKYPCGCKFEILSKDRPLKIKFETDMDKIPVDCSLTWDLFAQGNTKGIFQLETRLGQQSAKRLKPENIEQLAALVSIMRPGCLQAKRKDEGQKVEKSVTDHYIDRKNGEEEVIFFHDCLIPILGSTYGEMIYQEQAMQIAQVCAGFDLQQADILRKAIGKKKADIMAAIKQDFIDGCKNVGIITEEQAQDLFGWIEKSQRYSFNKSHAVSYAINGYLSAYAKAHFPASFFASYLYYAKDKQKKYDEINLLVNNAKVMGISINTPDFRQQNKHFKRIEFQSDDKIYDPYSDRVYFGIADIKGIGDKKAKKMDFAVYQTETSLGKHRKDWSWSEFLIFFSQETGVDSQVVTGMIEGGALDYFKVSRQRMLFEYQRCSLITNAELTWIKQNVKVAGRKIQDILSDALKPHYLNRKLKKEERPCNSKNRVKVLEDARDAIINPPHNLEDSPDWIARVEESALGISLTASIIDSCKDSDLANCTCLEFLKNEAKVGAIFIAAQIDDIKEHTTNKGKEMAFITISDGDADISAVCFAEDWLEIKSKGVCIPENTVMVSGERSKKNKDSLIIKKMWQLT